MGDVYFDEEWFRNMRRELKEFEMWLDSKALCQFKLGLNNRGNNTLEDSKAIYRAIDVVGEWMNWHTGDHGEVEEEE